MQGSAGGCMGARGCKGEQGDTRGCKGMKGEAVGCIRLQGGTREMQGYVRGCYGDVGRCRVHPLAYCMYCTPLHTACTAPCTVHSAFQGGGFKPAVAKPAAAKAPASKADYSRPRQTIADQGRQKHFDVRGATSPLHLCYLKHFRKTPSRLAHDFANWLLFLTFIMTVCQIKI